MLRQGRSQRHFLAMKATGAQEGGSFARVRPGEGARPTGHRHIRAAQEMTPCATYESVDNQALRVVFVGIDPP